MKLYELDIGDLAGKVVNKLSGQEKKEQDELNALAKKSAGMYKKTIDEFESIVNQNVQAFKDTPLESFEKWFESYFDRPVERIVDHPGLYNSIKNKIMDNAYAIIAYASMDYYLKAKTAQQGSEALLSIAPVMLAKDKNTLKIVEKLFSKYVVKNKNQEKISDKLDKKPKTGLVYKDGDVEYKFMGQQWVNTTNNQVARKEVAAQLNAVAIERGDTE